MENTTTTEDKPKSNPIPPELIGVPLVGTVHNVVKKLNPKRHYGFIVVGENPVVDENTVYIYFDKFGQEEKVTLRKGYIVSFVVQNDDKGRAKATQIKLTEEGNKIRLEKEAEFRAKYGDNNINNNNMNNNNNNNNMNNNNYRRKIIKLKVKYENSPEDKFIEVQVNSNPKYLKNQAAKVFDLEKPDDFYLYHVNLDTAPEGTNIRPVLLANFTDRDYLLLKSKPENNDAQN